MHNQYTRYLSMLAAFALGAFLTSPDALAQVETRSNYMGNDWTASWANVASWAAVMPYSFEPGDGLGGQIDQISMAHDNNFLYMYFDQATAFPYEHGSQSIYFDTDLNAATGNTSDFWWWGSSMGGVGAERSMYGAALWHHGDAMWTGDGVDNWAYADPAHTDGNYDILIQIHRSRLGNPTSFNWVGRMFGVDDYYPDAGSHHRYDAQPLTTVTAFGREWTVAEPGHRDNAAVLADVAGAPNSLTLNGVFGFDTNAVTPLTVQVGTRVSYDFKLTHDLVDPIGNGLEAWVGDAFGVFSSSGDNPTNANLASTRVGVVPGDDEATRVMYNDIGAGEEGFASLLDPTGTFVEHHLADGVHIEWSITSATTAEIAVYSADGSTLLGPKFTDAINMANIHGFRFNLWDSEQTLTVSNFTVGLVGDFNSDGLVNGLDLAGPGTGWQARFGGDLDGRDFLDWQQFFGTTSSATPATTIPEPAAIAIAFLALTGFTGTYASGWRRSGRPSKQVA